MFSEPQFCSPSPRGRRFCKPDFMELAKQNKQAQDPGEKPGLLPSACSLSALGFISAPFCLPTISMYSLSVSLNF